MGLFSFFKGKSKNKDESQVPNGPANEDGVTSGESMPSTPPAYMGLRASYIGHARNVNDLIHADNKHALAWEYSDKKKTLAGLDAEYNKMMQQPVPPSANEESVNEDKQKLEAAKKTAEDNMADLDDDMQKILPRKESLLKLKDTSTVRVIKHVGEIMADDATLHDTGDGLDAESKKALDLKKYQISVKRENSRVKNKEKKEEEKGDKKKDFASMILGHLENTGASVADGIEIMKDMGVKAKDAANKLKLGTQAKGELLKENSSGAMGHLGIVTALMAMLNTGLAAVALGKAAGQVFKRNQAGVVDNQERWLDCRKILGDISKFINSLIGAAAPFTSLVPMLGSVLGIVGAGFQLTVDTMNLITNITHSHKMSQEKDRLWAEIERKRKKYGDDKKDFESASFYDVNFKEPTGGGVRAASAASAEGKRRKRFRTMDTKRRGLLETVSKEMGVAEDPISEGSSKNTSKYRGAEAKISTMIASTRKSQKEDGGMNQADYKRKMHAMEALEIMSQYRTAEKASKKMTKSIVHNVESLITNGVKILGNGLKLAGEISAASGAGAFLIAAGAAVNIGEAGYEMVRDASTKAYHAWRKHTGAEANKLNTRNEMAEYMYDKMVSLTPGNVEWNGDFFKTDASVKDWQIRQVSKSATELHSVLRGGLDARMSELLLSTTSEEMKDSLASAFSQG